MANRIQGITVEIGGDTTKLQTALKGLNGEIKSTQNQLKDVEKLLKITLIRTTAFPAPEKKKRATNAFRISSSYCWFRMIL